MKFVEFENKRIEVIFGVMGFCLGCEVFLIVKCGDKNIWYWVYKGWK